MVALNTFRQNIYSTLLLWRSAVCCLDRWWYH